MSISLHAVPRSLQLNKPGFPETPRQLVIEWTADGTDYRVLADPPDEDFERGWSAIRLVLSDFEDPQTAAEILRAWPPD